ncbi:MAG: hypothetical protein VR78_17805 [Hoeflea sp. BRH_c9]|nr:MAG: hypothetical protein VR78_17805 [Hoeflea sp. BRH_c9]
MFNELEDVIFSEGQFHTDEYGVEFVDHIENGTSGDYVVLVSREHWDGEYLELFAQVHFIARTKTGFFAMRVPLVESFSDSLDVEHGATEQSEIYHVKQELLNVIGDLDDYRKRHGIRAELNHPFVMEDDPWDHFRRWLDVGRDEV